MSRRYRITEISKLTGIDGEILVEYIRKEWIRPDDDEFDDEDLTRARLINDLISHIGVNEEAVPIILHLIDQLHFLHHRIKNEISID